MAYMREAVNELIRARSFGGRPSIAEMPREEQLLCSSLRINSAVDLSPPKLHCFQISLKVTVRISSGELVTPMLKAFITQSFRGKLFPWPGIDDCPPTMKTLKYFSKRFHFETIVDPISEPTRRKLVRFSKIRLSISRIELTKILEKEKGDEIVWNAW